MLRREWHKRAGRGSLRHRLNLIVQVDKIGRYTCLLKELCEMVVQKNLMLIVESIYLKRIKYLKNERSLLL